MSRENSCIAEPPRTSAAYQSAILSQVSATEPSAYRPWPAHDEGVPTDALPMPIGAELRRSAWPPQFFVQAVVLHC